MNVELGSKWSIHPSEGMQGIDQGVVEVQGLLTYDAVDTGLANTWVDNAYDKEHEDDLVTKPWVAYRYISGGTDGDLLYLPIEEFTEHTEIYV